MNMKNKIVAILMASMVTMAVAAPMAFGGDQEAATTATVGNVAPVVTDTLVSPIVFPDNVTMNPCPDTTTINVTATVSDANGAGDIATVNVSIPGITTGEVAMNCVPGVPAETTKSCSKDIVLDCCQSPGGYTATVNATDASAAFDTDTDTFSISSTIDITVTDVDFEAVETNVPKSASSTVTNNGNAEIEFVDADPAGYDDPDTGTSIDGIIWSDMSRTGGGGTISDEQITTNWNSATTITCNTSLTAGFTLTVPEGTPTGTYGGTITFTPTEA